MLLIFCDSMINFIRQLLCWRCRFFFVIGGCWEHKLNELTIINVENLIECRNFIERRELQLPAVSCVATLCYGLLGLHIYTCPNIYDPITKVFIHPSILSINIYTFILFETSLGWSMSEIQWIFLYICKNIHVFNK